MIFGVVCNTLFNIIKVRKKSYKKYYEKYLEEFPSEETGLVEYKLSQLIVKK